MRAMRQRVPVSVRVRPERSDARPQTRLREFPSRFEKFPSWQGKSPSDYHSGRTPLSAAKLTRFKTIATLSFKQGLNSDCVHRAVRSLLGSASVGRARLC